MRALVAGIFTCLLLHPYYGGGEERPRPVSIIELIAAPEKFDGQVVTVRGFLLVSKGEHDLIMHFLCLAKEDAENGLGNQLQVVPNEQMLKDREAIDRVYVTLTGTVHAVRSANATYFAVIKDVRESKPWSDPNHPILLKVDNAKNKK